MLAKIIPPLFTLRGHNAGVTALAQCQLSTNSYLISGDEEGSIIIWDVSILRRIISFPTLLGSRTQSLKVITLRVVNERHSILLCQSREGEVQALDLFDIIESGANDSPKILATFPTYQALFSKGDAANINEDQAILAYPSYLENHLVTVRLVGPEVQTLISGTAQRSQSDKEKSFIVFDIVFKQTSNKELYLLVAYEDGCLCLFSFNLNVTITVPSLNSTGLKIDLVKKFNLNINEFISAFDVVIEEGDGILVVCGSPLKTLTYLAQYLGDIKNDYVLENIELKRKGVSALCIHPKQKLVAVACWDTTVRTYSMKSQKVLSSLNYHTKQVQSLIFVEKPDIYSCSTSNGQSGCDKNERKYLLCCASMDGTISISANY